MVYKQSFESHNGDQAETISSEQLLSLPWLVHAVTTRHFSSSSDHKREDLQRLAALLTIEPSAIAFCDQAHHDSIALLADEEKFNSLQSTDELSFYEFPRTDALITNHPAVMINVFTADCLPIFIVDIKRKIIGLVHAGWKGTLLRLLEKTIETFRYLRSNPQDLVLWLGPAIGRCCYEISQELMSEFQNAFPDFVDYYEGRHLDLFKLNFLQAQGAGVPREQIFSSDLCTRCRQDLLFSYRNHPNNCGRMISTMMITKET